MFDWSFLAFMTCRATFREFLAFACGVIATTLLSTLPGWVVQNPLFAKGTWTRNRTPMNSLLFYSFYSICVCKYPRITFIQHHRMHQVLGSPASSHATLSHVGRSGCSCSVVLLVVFWMISSPHIIINYHNLPHINDITTYSPHICQQPFFGVRSGNAGGTRFLWVTRDSCSLGSFPCWEVGTVQLMTGHKYIYMCVCMQCNAKQRKAMQCNAMQCNVM